MTPNRPLGQARAARPVTWGSIPLGALTSGFLASAFGAQTTLLILTGIMRAVAVAATLARGMRQLPSPPRAGETHGQVTVRRS